MLRSPSPCLSLTLELLPFLPLRAMCVPECYIDYHTKHVKLKG